MRQEMIDSYVRRTRDLLIKIAKNRETITYSALIREIGGLGRGYIGRVLQIVCRDEYERGRPLLGSLVVLAGTGHPGRGYWDGSPVSDSIGSSPKPEQLRYWHEQLDMVYAYWETHDINSVVEA